MKILFLLPPSESKNDFSKYEIEELSYNFIKPIDIANNISKKNMKCTWKRYLEWLELNKNINTSQIIEAINRYNWVMYNYVDYKDMNDKGKIFFSKNFRVFSSMYWILKSNDKIWNYKLPINTSLYDFWWDKISNSIVWEKPDYIVNLLSNDYAKLIWLFTNCNRHKQKLDIIINSWIKVININFLKPDWKKLSHWVKKIKWEWIKNICDNQIIDYKNFSWEIIENASIIDINIVIK